MMDIRTYLSQGKPLLFDGAMGTYFAAHPGRAEERCERANLTRPEEILRIHRAYLQAGCRAIKTNTFAISGDLSDGNDETACDIVNAACHLGLMYLQIWAPRPVTTAAPRQIYTRRRRSGFWNRG